MEQRPLDAVVAENQLLWSALENLRDRLDDLVVDEDDEGETDEYEADDYEFGYE